MLSAENLPSPEFCSEVRVNISRGLTWQLTHTRQFCSLGKLQNLLAKSDMVWFNNWHSSLTQKFLAKFWWMSGRGGDAICVGIVKEVFVPFRMCWWRLVGFRKFWLQDSLVWVMVSFLDHIYLSVCLTPGGNPVFGRHPVTGEGKIVLD